MAKYKSLKEKAYSIIRKKIISCDLMPGDIVNEKELIEEIKTSRTPIREALNLLEKENLVKILPKKGVIVTNVNTVDIYNIFSVRKIIEPFVAKTATKNIKLDELNYFYKAYTSTNELSLIEYLELSRKFHLTIYDATNNQYLKDIALNIYDQSSRIRFLLRRIDKTRKDRAHKEHIDLIKAFLERDEAKAEQLMSNHIEMLEKKCLGMIPVFKNHIQ